MTAPFYTLLIGGRGHHLSNLPHHIHVRTYGSQRDRGNGDIHKAIAAIRGGRVHLVVLLQRWLGHSAFSELRSACRRAKVRMIMIRGGLSSAKRAILRICQPGPPCKRRAWRQ